MAFDDLTHEQIKFISNLIEKIQTGDYKNFFEIKKNTSGWLKAWTVKAYRKRSKEYLRHQQVKQY